MNHLGKRLFITGIPTSGKSYLAKKLAEATGGIAVILDDFREDLATDERYAKDCAKWVNFYIDQDEKTYLTTTSPDDQWKNLVAQSEAFWPAMLDKITSYADEKQSVIFECVNLLPHLAKKDLDFSGVVLIGSTFEETLRRNMADPRWGATPELQELEARTFFENERPKYKAEGEKYGYVVFETADGAMEMCLKFLKYNAYTL